MYSDKTLTCKECGVEFTFSASEQEFYAEKGFQNEPARAAPNAVKEEDAPETMTEAKEKCSPSSATSVV